MEKKSFLIDLWLGSIALTVMLLGSACNRHKDRSAAIGNPDFLHSRWITDKRAEPVADSLMYGDFPAPLFRKEFTIQQEIISAKLHITAAGYYNASINGKKIGFNYLDPAWTNYGKRIYYTEYDITPEIKKGNNCIGITLGNGFYNPLPMKMWGRFNLRDALPSGKPKFIASLKIIFSNGKSEELTTDHSWKFSLGPVMRNNVYLGEVYDAGQEIPGWDLPGFDDSGWKNTVETAGPGGKLERAFFPPVQVTGTFKPATVNFSGKGTFIADLGENITGIYRIRLRGNKGDTITFRFGERLYEDGTLNPMTAVCGQIKRKGTGGPGAPDVAWQTDSYVFGDKREVWFSPLFTFHVFRYMEITGLEYAPEIADIEGLALNTNVEDHNDFTCSSDLINSVQKAVERTFSDNLISVQSDCPGREKFGYGGDLNATSESFIYNYDMHSFYKKTLYDWVDVINDSIFIDTAPYVGLKYCGISWESAFITTQYRLFLYYNDTSIIRELYSLDLEWMKKAERLNPSGVSEKGLADHESLVRVPVALIGTTHYLDCARIMKRFANIMNDAENEKKFEKLAGDLTNSLLDIFWRKSVPDTINRQTLFAALLYYDIIPENQKKAAVDSLLKAVEKGPSGHFTTGIFGTKYILEALSSNAKAGTVFNIVNSTAWPGWGFMTERGATTIWETWKESDNVFSNCHPMFGSVTEWFYRWLGGIQPDPENPGFKRFILRPYLPPGLEYAKCSYRSPFGTIRSNWIKTTHGVKFEISVPKETTALFSIPDKTKTFAYIENTDTRTMEKKNIRESESELELNEGNYVISY